MMEPIRRWLTFKLVRIANTLHGELFIRLCEVAVVAKYRDSIEEALRDTIRLEQEHAHDHDYYNEREDYDTDSNTTRSARNTTKFH